MSDARGKVLYVGKAKNLRARIHQYAGGGGDGRPQIPHLLRRVAAVRCIVTSSEKEALLLENTMIKEHRPPFNIFLRDDKEYLLLRIDRAEKYPRPELVRRVAKDGAMYFGPFSGSSIAFSPFVHVPGKSFPHGRGRASITRWAGASGRAPD